MANNPHVKVTLDFDSKAKDELLKGSPVQIKRILRLMTNHIAKDVRHLTALRVAEKSGTQKTGFKRVRTANRLARVRATSKGISASVWFGGNDIEARFGGRMSQNAAGARAGSHFFAGSRILTMKSGYRGIFHNDSTGKLVLDKFKVVPLAPEINSIARQQRLAWQNELRAITAKVLK